MRIDPSFSGEQPKPADSTTTRRTTTDDARRIRLRQAVRDFEAIVVGFMLKSMRSTVVKAEEEQTFGGDVLQQLFDLEFARHVSQKRGLGLGDLLYKKLAGNVPEASPENREGETGRTFPISDLVKAVSQFNHQQSIPLFEGKRGHRDED